MKKIIILFACLLCFSCRQTLLTYSGYIEDVTETTKPEINILDDINTILENTTYTLFYKTCLKIKIPQSIKSKITPSDKIAIYSADRLQLKYSDIQPIIEFVLKQTCIKSDIQILEREPTSLKRIGNEQNHTFFSQSFPNDSLSPDKMFKSIDKLFGGKAPELPKDSPSTLNIVSADKIITYRTIDAGNNKIKMPSGKMGVLTTIDIQLNLIEITTGRLLAAEQVTEFDFTEITPELNQSLVAFQLENTKYPLPLIFGFPSDKDLILSAQSKKKQIERSGKMKFVFVLGDKKSTAIISDINSKEVFRFPIPSNYPHDTHTFFWDIKDNNGIPIPKGVYIINVKDNSGNTLSTSQFVL